MKTVYFLDSGYGLSFMSCPFTAEPEEVLYRQNPVHGRVERYRRVAGHDFLLYAPERTVVEDTEYVSRKYGITRDLLGLASERVERWRVVSDKKRKRVVKDEEQ